MIHVGTSAMAGGQVTYEFGYCPQGYKPFCCAAVVSLLLDGWRVRCADTKELKVAAGVGSGCGLPTQVYEPKSGKS